MEERGGEDLAEEQPLILVGAANGGLAEGAAGDLGGDVSAAEHRHVHAAEAGADGAGDEDDARVIELDGVDEGDGDAVGRVVAGDFVAEAVEELVGRTKMRTLASLVAEAMSGSAMMLEGSLTSGIYFMLSCFLLIMSVSLRPLMYSSWTHIRTSSSKTSLRRQFRPTIFAMAHAQFPDPTMATLFFVNQNEQDELCGKVVSDISYCASCRYYPATGNESLT